MADSRLQIRTQVKHGDRTLTTLSSSLDIQVIDDRLDQSSGLKRRLVPTGTTDLELDFTTDGITDARYFYLETDRQISLKFNDSANPAITIRPPSEDPFGQIVDTNIKVVGTLSVHISGTTSVFITNSSGNEANVMYLIAGRST